MQLKKSKINLIKSLLKNDTIPLDFIMSNLKNSKKINGNDFLNLVGHPKSIYSYGLIENNFKYLSKHQNILISEFYEQRLSKP